MRIGILLARLDQTDQALEHLRNAVAWAHGSDVQERAAASIESLESPQVEIELGEP